MQINGPFFGASCRIGSCLQPDSLDWKPRMPGRHVIVVPRGCYGSPSTGSFASTASHCFRVFASKGSTVVA